MWSGKKKEELPPEQALQIQSAVKNVTMHGDPIKDRTQPADIEPMLAIINAAADEKNRQIMTNTNTERIFTFAAATTRNMFYHSPLVDKFISEMDSRSMAQTTEPSSLLDKLVNMAKGTTRGDKPQRGLWDIRH